MADSNEQTPAEGTAAQFFCEKKSKRTPNIQAIAEMLQRQNALLCTGTGSSQRWYRCEDGLWRPHSVDEMRVMARDLFLELGMQQGFTDARRQLTVRLLDSILKMVTVDVHKVSIPRMHPDVIPCANGVVLRWNSEEKGFIETEMMPEFFITHTLSVDYVPEARHDLFDEKLQEIIPDDDNRRVVQEYLGAALFAENRSRRILLFKGEGSTGKSMLVKLLSKILGRERVFDLEFGLLGKDYSFAGLNREVTLLSASETASRDLCGKGGSWAKKLVGGDEFQSSLKYRNDRANYVGFFTVIMTSNEEVRLDFTSSGQEWKDRLLPVVFEHSIPIERQDKNLVERLLRQEGSGILNWLLEGARRIRKNNWNILLTPAQEAVRDKIIGPGCNSIEVFIRKFIEPDVTEAFTSEDAYRLYCHVFKEMGLEFLPSTIFFTRIAKGIGERFGKQPENTIQDSRGRQVRGYRGLRLKCPT